jgi:hypothetical protein
MNILANKKFNDVSYGGKKNQLTNINVQTHFVEQIMFVSCGSPVQQILFIAVPGLLQTSATEPFQAFVIKTVIMVKVKFLCLSSTT